ncbi:MAG TPA: DNA mismatch repair endonuclease MutL [Pyrinomonadaceae bacterium]|jgi:DNA mismatch repair protein MutL
MSKIRALSDLLINQIAAGEVVERPASVVKELVENSIDAGALRITIDSEAGGRRLLRVLDDGEGMTRDDALLAFERHATSKISNAEDLNAIATLGFRGEALASIASVARVELITKTEDAGEATRVVVEGGRVRDVKSAAHTRGTSITVRDLFFNVPARRKFLRSEATESFHLTNLVTHYALAHPEIAFTLTNNGRETLRATPARDLRERAYQIFGAEFINNLLEISGGQEQVARISGYISAPLERRTSRDAQYLFINGRYVRDRLLGRALSEGYRSVLPHGTYPAALLFLEVPLGEVDVNVHPAKTEVRFRRAAAVADAVRECVREALASAGYTRRSAALKETNEQSPKAADEDWTSEPAAAGSTLATDVETRGHETLAKVRSITERVRPARDEPAEGAINLVHSRQSEIEFGLAATLDEALPRDEIGPEGAPSSHPATENKASAVSLHPAMQEAASFEKDQRATRAAGPATFASPVSTLSEETDEHVPSHPSAALPHIASIADSLREVSAESLKRNVRPLAQLEESYILASDDEGLLLIEQHAAHERILFDKYLALEAERRAGSQQMLIPEIFDLTPAQAAAFDALAAELESYGFGLMRLSGRTVAIRAVPADLPAGEARSMLAEILDAVDTERRGKARANLHEEIAASLARHAATKAHTPLAPEKMEWLIDQLLKTSSPTTCPHGRPTILRLGQRDIEKGFHKA